MKHIMGGRDKMFADILLNTRDEVLAYIGAYSLLNCARVIIESARYQSTVEKTLSICPQKKSILSLNRNLNIKYCRFLRKGFLINPAVARIQNRL